ncbi:MAG TPA: hypothetical protein K8W25_00575 [Aerococcus urinaeequi]|nr:hypothetical protein [Aerococcus urinaeequi]
MNYNLTYDDLENRLKDEINLLIDLCYQFDLGKYAYANVIATKIGSIINFNNKDSILPNMNKQNEMAFWSTAKVLEFTDNVLFFRSLVAVSSNKNEMRYYPKFNHGKYLQAWVTFNKWAKTNKN